MADFFVASIQINIEAEPEQNISKAQSLTEKAIDQGAQVIVLPELFLSGVIKDPLVAENVVEKAKTAIEIFKEIALEKGVFIFSGMPRKANDGRFFNSLYLFSRDGSQIIYDKIHLFEPFDEHKIFSPGQRPVNAALKIADHNITAGLMICFDLRFPELSRHYGFNGTELMIASSLWPSSRKENFCCLMRARAMENQCFFIVSNGWGETNGVELGGLSSVIAPNGKVISRITEGQGIALAGINLSEIKRLKDFFNCSRPPGIWFVDGDRKILCVNELKAIVERRKAAGQKLVFTNGCFDILHAGHVSYLKQARSLGDFLVVGLNSDSSVKRIKGETRPINPQEHRAKVLSSISYVDFIVFFDDDTPEELIKALVPDVLVKGADWEEDAIVGADFVKTHGGKVARIPFEVDTSTTSIIKQAAKAIMKAENN